MAVNLGVYCRRLYSMALSWRGELYFGSGDATGKNAYARSSGGWFSNNTVDILNNSFKELVNGNDHLLVFYSSINAANMDQANFPATANGMAFGCQGFVEIHGPFGVRLFSVKNGSAEFIQAADEVRFSLTCSPFRSV